MFGDTAGVVDIVNRATTMLRGLGRLELREATLVPELHGEADDGLAALVHDCGDGGAVHSSAHGDRYGGDCAGSKRQRAEDSVVGSCGKFRAALCGFGYGVKRLELCEWICHSRFTVHAPRLRTARRQRAQTFDRRRDDCRFARSISAGGCSAAEAETQTRTRFIRRQANSQQHVRRLNRSG
jgi:hypothetical protein